MNVLGIIPARGGSKRIHQKNIKKLNGFPLISYTIKTALKSRIINKLIVSTDDEGIAAVAEDYGAEVPFRRPSEFAGDNSHEFYSILHSIEKLKENNWHTDIIVFLRPTCIFRTEKSIDSAVQKLQESSYDSVRAISKAVYPPHWMKRIEKNRYILLWIITSMRGHIVKICL